MERTAWTDERLDDAFTELRADMREFRTEMRAEFRDLRREVHAEISQMKLAMLGGNTAIIAAIVATNL